DRKLRQMIIAHEVGFTITQTVISSDWAVIKERLLQTDEALVAIKMLRAVISDNDELKVMYTNVANRQKIEDLATRTYPFPAHQPPDIETAREWRVTAVGDSVFPVAIYTDKSAKQDWRRHQTASAVELRKETVPEAIGEKCVRYLAKMSLK